MIVYVVGLTNGCIFYDDIPLRQPEDTRSSFTDSLSLSSCTQTQTTPAHTAPQLGTVHWRSPLAIHIRDVVILLF